MAIDLARGRVLRTQDLMDQFQVTKRTVFRDLDEIAKSGVVVGYIPELGGYTLRSLEWE